LRISTSAIWSKQFFGGGATHPQRGGYMKVGMFESEYRKRTLADAILKTKRYKEMLVKDKNKHIVFDYAICVAYKEGIDAFLKLDIPSDVKSEAIYYIMNKFGLYYLTKDEKRKLIDSVDPSVDLDWDDITTKGVAPLLTKKFPVEKIPYAYLVSNRKSDVKKALEYYKNNKLPYRNIHITKFLGSVLLEFNDKDLIAKFVRSSISACNSTESDAKKAYNLIKKNNLSALDIVNKQVRYYDLSAWVRYLSNMDIITSDKDKIEFFKPVFEKYKKEFNIRVIDNNAKTSIEITIEMLDWYKEFVKEKKEAI
jgi:hypothetical protein